MADWDFTGDQYYVDTDSRYPLFSDIQTTDYSIAPVAKKYEREPQITKSSKSNFRNEPVTGCQCDSCVYSRWLHSQRSRAAQVPAIKQPDQIITFAPLGYMNVDSGVIMMVFMFMVIVFICCFYTRSISKLKSKIKMLKRQIG